MTTLYLHIGTHRTATSSIQAFMLANWDAMLARGILHPLRIARHFAFFNAIFSGKRSVTDVAQELTLRSGRHPYPIHTILLSDEDVCMRADLTMLGEFARHFDVKVIVALRRQDLWLESWYLQNIKWQWDKSLSHCTLPEFLGRAEEFHWIYYDRLLRHLEGIFGHDNILPYVFETAQMPQGPVAAFCERLGVGDLTGLKPSPHVNSSYTPAIAEFVRQLPFDEAPDKYRARLEMAVKAVDRTMAPEAGNGSARLLDHETRSAIMVAHAAGNAAVARRYFGRDALFLEPLPGPDTPLAELTLPSDSAVLMRDFVAPMIRALIRQNLEPPPKNSLLDSTVPISRTPGPAEPTS